MKPDLLFAATEFGVFFTPERRRRWVKLSGDVPTISFRDLAIQRRENDLVCGSFGRGIFVLDDYSALRERDRGGPREGGRALPGAQGAGGTSSATRSASRAAPRRAPRTSWRRTRRSARCSRTTSPRRSEDEGEAAAGGREAARRGGEGHAVPRLDRGRGRAARARARRRARGEGRVGERRPAGRREDREGVPPGRVGPAPARDAGGRLAHAASATRTTTARPASSRRRARTPSRS